MSQAQHERVGLITGITGQDGSYLAELLLEKGYYVIGIVRRNSLLYNSKRIEHIRPRIHLKYGDMTDGSSLSAAVGEALARTAPDGRLEIYNLAAQSHVAVSYEVPEHTFEVNALGVLKLLEAIRRCSPSDQSRIRLYQAGTSEMFGNSSTGRQSETTPFDPVSPYSAAKVYAHHITTLYRSAYGLHITNGILFNHESPRRGLNFLTMKTVNAARQHGVAHIQAKAIPPLRLGNLNSRRDWGFAGDYVRGIWSMVQREIPDDYVLATGKCYTVREFVTAAFKHFGLELRWEGADEQERAVDQDGVVRVVVSSEHFRPTEVNYLEGDPSKAVSTLGWAPTTVDLDALIECIADDW